MVLVPWLGLKSLIDTDFAVSMRWPFGRAISVFGRESVPVNAEFFPCVLIPVVSLSAAILFWRHCFQVLWIATERFATEVINFVSFWNWPNQQNVSQPVGCGLPTIPPDLAIFDSVRSMDGCGPDPAAGFFDLQFRLQPFWQISNFVSKHKRPHDAVSGVVGAIFLLEREG